MEKMEKRKSSRVPKSVYNIPPRPRLVHSLPPFPVPPPAPGVPPVLPRKFDLSPIDMPRVLKHNLDYLERWAMQNQKDARRDTIRFWLFKIPVILGAAIAPIIAFFGTSEWSFVGLIVGGVASAGALIDGIYPSGMLRNVHYKASHELRELQRITILRWDTYCQRVSPERLTRKLLEMNLKKTEEISAYIKEAEISLRH